MSMDHSPAVLRAHCCIFLRRVYLRLVVGSFFLLAGCSNVRLEQASPPSLPRTVSLKVNGYCASETFQLGEIFPVNHSGVLTKTGWLIDTDRDFLPDKIERDMQIADLFGISYLNEDTSGDGYRDIVAYRLGKDINSQSSFRVCDDKYQDTDKDGLFDCEEVVLGTDYQLADTDLDGIPDGLEFRHGLNPLDPSDAISDSNRDGMSNLRALSLGRVIEETVPSWVNEAAVKVSLDTYGSCADVTIDDIPVLPVKNGNLFEVQFYERRYDGVPQVRYVKVLIEKEIEFMSEIIIADPVMNSTYNSSGIQIASE